MAHDNDINFEIQSVTTERRINGYTHIIARCVEDGTRVEVSIANSMVCDKGCIKKLLMDAYETIVKDNIAVAVHVGDVL